jgi:hypothetical protein
MKVLPDPQFPETANLDEDTKLYAQALHMTIELLVRDIAKRLNVLNKLYPHGDLIELDEDDHSQYPLMAGRSGGQTIAGGTDSGDDLTLKSTEHATKGNIMAEETVVIQRILAGGVQP